MLEFYMLVFIYLILWSAFCFAAFLFKKIFEKSKNTEIALKQTKYVLILFSLIYFVPILGMIISAFTKPIYIFLIGYSMIFSAIPVTYLIIIPLLDRRKIRFIEEVYGKNSEEAKYERKKYNNK